eukprot:scaffold13516_cov32-Attheya_sp.AAC.1
MAQHGRSRGVTHSFFYTLSSIDEPVDPCKRAKYNNMILKKKQYMDAVKSWQTGTKGARGVSCYVLQNFGHQGKERVRSG